VGDGPCADPIGAATNQQLTAARFDAAIADMRAVSEQAASASEDELAALFSGDAHNITHDVDGPLRDTDRQLAMDLCESVVVIETQLGGQFDRAAIAEEAAVSADLLEEAARVLGVTD
jgi:hypothetical protein